MDEKNCRVAIDSLQQERVVIVSSNEFIVTMDELISSRKKLSYKDVNVWPWVQLSSNSRRINMGKTMKNEENDSESEYLCELNFIVLSSFKLL